VVIFFILSKNQFKTKLNKAGLECANILKAYFICSIGRVQNYIYNDMSYCISRLLICLRY